MNKYPLLKWPQNLFLLNPLLFNRNIMTIVLALALTTVNVGVN